MHLDQAGLIPESQWFQERQRNDRYDLYSKASSREMPKEKCRPLHDLVDPTKAFDTVSRDGFWKIMAKFGFHPESWPWCGNFIMACRHVFRIMKSTLNHFR